MRKPRRTRFSASSGRFGKIQGFDGAAPPPEQSLPDSEDGESAPSTEAPSPDPVERTTGGPDNSSPSSPFRLRLFNARRSRARRKRIQMLIACGCLLAGMLGGYLLARYVEKPLRERLETGTREGTAQIAPGELAGLDAAFDARYNHQSAEAERLFAELGRQHRNWPMLEVELGRTLIFQGKLIEARAVLNAATAKELTAADAYFALGVLNMVQTNYREGEASLAMAVARDPTRPDYYFLWGECLRDDGKPREAAERYRSALLRNSYETANGLYRLKLWLSEIDANEDKDGLGAALDAGLAQASPPMEILFAAAARDLKAGNPSRAVEHMRLARGRTDPEVYSVVLNDPTFVQVKTRPDFVELFRPVPVASSPQVPGK